jgi:7,8-dihydropterin-6-yl-methyl-4-(beta-D-ribofuranosyl)aminobenzene 5'-phosphate synthase
MTRRGRSAVQPGSGPDYKPVALVIGGFHMMGASRNQVESTIEELRELGVKQISPTHCTGDDVIAIFAELLGEDYIQVGAGKVITLP